MIAVQTHSLCKSYGEHPALIDVDLSVPPGSLFGFLGPNGAGKTTALRILMGLLRSTAGKAHVLGCDAWRQGREARKEIGYVPGDVRLYDALSGRQTLDFFSAARGVDCRDEIGRLARKFDLDMDKRVREYSRGMKQKLVLLQALIHRPQLLILDEPTTGLDPLVRDELFDELRAVARDGRTVLFSSHTLSEVDALCDRVAIVRAGRLIEQERVDILRGRAVRRIDIEFQNQRPAAPAPAALRILHEADGRLTGTWSGEIEPLLVWLAQAKVRDVTIAAPGLEELFMTYYADGAGEEAS